jgi:hypothetical protein
LPTQPPSPKAEDFNTKISTKKLQKGTPSFKQGSKRTSVAAIPAARLKNISPIRASFDNLAGVFHSSKNSLMMSPNTAEMLGSRKHSMPKVIVNGVPYNSNNNLKEGANVEVYFVEKADSMTKKKRKHSTSEGFNFLGSNSQMNATAE